MTETGQNISYVGVGRRFVAHFADLIISFVGLGVAVAALTGDLTATGFRLQGLPALGLFVLIFAYFWLFEGLLGATPGKLLLGIRVKRVDGGSCGLVEALVRNLLRVVDALLFYLVAAVLVWSNDKRQRLGDMAAKTVVVRKN